MFGSDNILAAKIISENLKSGMEDQLSLSKTTENLNPVKNRKFGYKTLLVVFISVIFTGFCYTNTTTGVKDKHHQIISQYHV